MITKEYLQQELAKRIDGYKRGVETSTDNIISEMKSILVLVDALPDHEKKYNEALERASHIKDNNTVATPQEVAEHIFPELRESEDERIRKGLIAMLSQDKELHRREIAYLEKQKEQQPAWSEEDEAFLKVAIAICNRYSHKNIADWLKSLRPVSKESLQPHWKPSEEQIEGNNEG